MDSEMKRTSVRANLLEKRRFELLMSSFESAKRNVAVDMKKTQLDFKRRLKRYKDRQREIVLSRPGSSPTSLHEFMFKQMERRSHLPLSVPRPITSPLLLGNNQDGVSESVKGTQESARESLQNDTESENYGKISHCKKSKADLRPSTAWTVINNSSASNRAASGSAQTLLHMRVGSLGSPARQARYLNDEEIEERCTFYRFLVDGYRQMEQEHLQILNCRVQQFCGKQVPLDVKGDAIQDSFPPIFRHLRAHRIAHSTGHSHSAVVY